MDVRPASHDDLDRCVEIMYAEPERELLALLPSIEGAARMMRAAWRSPDGFLVAVDGDQVVGFAQTGSGSDSLLSFAGPALKGFGPIGVVRLLLRGRSRRRVDLPMPAGTLGLVELQVDPGRRSQGIGARLLDAVVVLAGDRPISLTTRIDNPARHLYERFGFEVVAEKRDASYEAATGSPGRVLMVRPVPFTRG